MAALVACAAPIADPVFSGPFVLWAWERPEDLRFLEAGRFGVAALMGTLELSGEDVLPRSRRQPLLLADGGRFLAVVRLESSLADPPSLLPVQRRIAVEAILRWGESSAVAGLQIDFDATLSERSFYRALLEDVRERLPREKPLTITALASWCVGDPWLEDLPIESAVPMLFRMGIDAPAIRRMLEEGGDFRQELCRRSVGVSTDEPLPRIPRGRRVYLFHPEPWTREALALVVREIEGDRR